MTPENSTPEENPTPPTGAKPPRKGSTWDVYYPKDVKTDRDAIPIASFPMIIYFWPSLLAMLACGMAQAITKIDPNTVGWLGVGCLCFNLMVIVTDLDQKKFLITVLTLVALGLGLWITNLKDLGIVSGLAGWLGGLEVSMSTDAYFVLFAVLFFFFLVGMIQPRFNYWRLEPNEFVHYVQPWGRDQSIPRVGSTVAREVPDMLELILTFGGGTLVIRREGQVVARIRHVPFLSRRMVAIERMLGVTRVQDVSG
ncbi:MAG: hypothetical protein AAF682_06375 [Planctomycetota bacterium]